MVTPLAVVDAGVDWITATVRKTREIEKLYHLYRELRENVSQRDYVEKEWRFSGYRGYHCGSIDFGVRHDGAIIRLSSYQANDHWRKAYALANSVTRLDYQLTTYHDELAARRIGRAFKEVRKWATQAENRCTVKLISGTNGAETVYVGSRHSESYGRIYDKGLESGDNTWSNCVRHEVEFKGGMARTAAHSLAQAKMAQDEVVAQCSAWFRIRGHAIPLASATCVYRQHRITTDVERRLTWIRNQVRPFIQERRGYRDLPRVFQALGIDEETLSEYLEQLYEQEVSQEVPRSQ